MEVVVWSLWTKDCGEEEKKELDCYRDTKHAQKSDTMRTCYSLPAAHDEDDFSLSIDEESGEAPKWAEKLLSDGSSIFRTRD